MGLKTSVPDVRPKARSMGFYDGPRGSGFGAIESYAPLSPAHENVGRTLREIRMLLGLSLREAAERLDVSVVYVSECERGVRTFELAEALDILGRANVLAATRKAAFEAVRTLSYHETDEALCSAACALRDLLEDRLEGDTKPHAAFQTVQELADTLEGR